MMVPSPLWGNEPSGRVSEVAVRESRYGDDTAFPATTPLSGDQFEQNCARFGPQRRSKFSKESG
jgi:hypothetical protein